MTNATANEICKLATTPLPRTPPKICVIIKSGKVASSNATTKNNRPHKLPRIICRLESGVVNNISQVFGLLSCAIAPAIKMGVNKQIAATCPKLIRVNALAPRCAKSFRLPPGPSNEKKTSTIKPPKYTERISKWRVRVLPPLTIRRAIALLGPRARNQLRRRGTPAV